jgi:hypothetical protein
MNGAEFTDANLRHGNSRFLVPHVRLVATPIGPSQTKTL